MAEIDLCRPTLCLTGCSDSAAAKRFTYCLYGNFLSKLIARGPSAEEDAPWHGLSGDPGAPPPTPLGPTRPRIGPIHVVRNQTNMKFTKIIENLDLGSQVGWGDGRRGDGAGPGRGVGLKCFLAEKSTSRM